MSIEAKKIPMVIIAGPTGVGKTALSIGLSKAIGGEIISLDSMQVYRGMDIGTAKITKEEMQGVPHHLLDVVDPEDEFNISIFQEMAKKAISEIYERGHIPILVGGTGFYINAIIYDTDFSEYEDDGVIRKRLLKELEELGNHEFHEKLKDVDPESYETIHENNTKRVVRALEYYEITGSTISEHNKTEKEKQSPYNFAYFVLNKSRDRLYEDINRRVDIMMEDGLLDEVKSLRDRGLDRSYVSMQGLGYKEILAYLDGECSLEEAVDTLKKGTRHFAKRQLTFFKSCKDAEFIDKEGKSAEELIDYITDILRDRNILHD